MRTWLKIISGSFLFFWGIDVLTDVPRLQAMIGKMLMIAGAALVLWGVNAYGSR